MKRTVLILVLSLVFVPTLALAQKQPTQAKQAPAGASAVEQQILQLEQGWSAAGQKHDKAFLQKLYAEEYLYTNSDGALANKAEDIAGMDKVKFVSFKLEDMKVHVYGNTAVVTGLNTIHAMDGTKDISGPYRFTDVFVNRDGRWQVVATQSSKVTKK